MNGKVPTSTEQKRIVAKAKHYLGLVGGDFTSSKENITAMAMAIGWVLGKDRQAKGFEDIIEVGFQVAKQSELLSSMAGSASILAMKSDTIEEGLLGEENEEAA